jgi:hypothetical protein
MAIVLAVLASAPGWADIAERATGVTPLSALPPPTRSGVNPGSSPMIVGRLEELLAALRRFRLLEHMDEPRRSAALERMIEYNRRARLLMQGLMTNPFSPPPYVETP